MSHAGARQGKHSVAGQAPGTGSPKEKEGSRTECLYFTEYVIAESRSIHTIWRDQRQLPIKSFTQLDKRLWGEHSYCKGPSQGQSWAK